MILLNGQPLEFRNFPNGETLVNGEQILTLAGVSNLLSLKYENDGDLIKLMFVKNFLDDHRYQASLILYYMPYSRMDRVEGSSVFTLKYTANFINAMNFEEVTVVEPHSDVCMALIHGSRAKYPSVELLDQVIQETGFNPDQDYLFFPDAGAQKRYGKVKGFRQLVGFKVRDFQTGQIQNLDIVGSVEKPGFKVIIVDDLCSYGGTFLLSAERLREIGASEVYLLVGHCEKSVFQGKIPHSNLLDRVFTTDTMLDQTDSDKFQIYKIGGM
ncbi:ribose-phosphate pyrophosphokinase [Cohnella sp. CFH 77786]|uniref:ribose-phosphate pyrophosphokinase n=1 Tax=Cohnella sp. CFH 77786 TaxID=2662265 RepID=UPI001C60A0A8|nr:ribose-phosphate pyrophosphokinase [Cohnella sp. CFH 77786]MBW5447659.1 ribose-phosphate pyrophosphokinase [Cohnella sp. CFH 77786]